MPCHADRIQAHRADENVVDDFTGFDKSEHIAAFVGKNNIGQRKRFEDIDKPFFTALDAFGYSFKFAEIITVKGNNQIRFSIT